MAKNFCVALIFVIIFTLLNSNNCTVAETEKCPNQNPCSCSHGDDEIDLSGLVLPSEGFLETTHENITYFFSGCKDKTFDPLKHHIVPGNISKPFQASLVKYRVGIPIVNASISNATTSLNLIGSAADISFVITTENEKQQYQIIYSTKENKNSPSIELVCVDLKSSDLTVANSESDALRLYSPYACPVKHSHGLSSGSILLIIFFVLVFLYFGVGAILLYYIRGARDIEVIPHVDFFRELPGLVRDGVIFIFSGCKTTTISTAETYDRI